MEKLQFKSIIQGSSIPVMCVYFTLWQELLLFCSIWDIWYLFTSCLSIRAAQNAWSTDDADSDDEKASSRLAETLNLYTEDCNINSLFWFLVSSVNKDSRRTIMKESTGSE